MSSGLSVSVLCSEDSGAARWGERSLHSWEVGRPSLAAPRDVAVQRRGFLICDVAVTLPICPRG